MLIKKETFKTLDFDFVLDKLNVHSPYGESLKRAISPFDADDVDDVRAMQEEYALQAVVLERIGRYRYEMLSLRNELDPIKDLRGSLLRIIEGETLTLTELFEIKSFVLQLQKLERVQGGIKPPLPEAISVTAIPEVIGLLDPEGTGTSTFYLYDAYSEQLKEIRGKLKAVEEAILLSKKTCRESIESQYGVKVRAGGEVQVIKHENVLIESFDVHPSLDYASDKSLYRVYQLNYGDEVKALEEEQMALKVLEEREEQAVCDMLTESLLPHVPCFEEAMSAIGRLDLTLAKSYFALGYNCVEPSLILAEPTVKSTGEKSCAARISIEEGRYIKTENQLKASGKQYVPVSIEVSSGVTCITGANMGGKTMSLKMLGQLVLMAQCGLFVPAKAMAFTPIKFISTSIGDEQNVDKGLSTFGAEIYTIKGAIDQVGDSGLLLIDELARGTNPKEGQALSKAIIDHLKHKPAITVITTHFDGLADGPDVHHLQVIGLKTDTLEKLKVPALLEERSHSGRQASGALDFLNDHMDYRLRTVETPESVPKDAITISEILGLHTDILEAARRIIKESSNIGGNDAK